MPAARDGVWDVRSTEPSTLPDLGTNRRVFAYEVRPVHDENPSAARIVGEMEYAKQTVTRHIKSGLFARLPQRG